MSGGGREGPTSEPRARASWAPVGPLETPGDLQPCSVSARVSAKAQAACGGESRPLPAWLRPLPPQEGPRCRACHAEGGRQPGVTARGSLGACGGGPGGGCPGPRLLGVRRAWSHTWDHGALRQAMGSALCPRGAPVAQTQGQRGACPPPQYLMPSNKSLPLLPRPLASAARSQIIHGQCQLAVPVGRQESCHRGSRLGPQGDRGL